MDLTDGELKAMRAEMKKLLPDDCTIYTSVWTADGMGGGTTTWTAGKVVSCRLDPLDAKEGIVGAGLQPFEKYMLTVPYNTALTTEDRVQVGTVTYQVTSINLSPSWKLDKRAVVEQVWS